jgi:hypothetical protein
LSVADIGEAAVGVLAPAPAVASASPSPLLADVAKGIVASKRLPQDIAVGSTPPSALPTTRPIGRSATQNAAKDADVAAAQAAGATDIRVNQQQVNAAGERVGVNRPDLQYTDANGNRVYIE